MTNPLGTAEQRDEARTSLDDTRWLSEVEADILLAFDGLDIAQKAMRALAVRRYFQEHEDSWKPCYWRYDDAATQAEDEALAEWDKWVGE